ncbi:hypothetical protein [Streptomyces narbonensis]|uniref:hypothetical protein n=1 Tax=Streptomyces narbonensis TaxID=67333 RepID=UPI0033C40A65
MKYEKGVNSRRDCVKHLLHQRGAARRWVTTVELEHVDIGGSAGTMRARELRKPEHGGLTLDVQKVKGSSQRVYRIAEFWGAPLAAHRQLKLEV